MQHYVKSTEINVCFKITALVDIQTQIRNNCKQDAF